jgi:carbamoyl-phosphate synthase small subunit
MLVLADGTVFEGEALGADGIASGEVVFTTVMTGYPEVLTDPSYAGQLVTMTAPEIGNYGCTLEDAESLDQKPHAAGLIVRSVSPVASNWRSQMSLHEYLFQHGIVGITGLDTRRLTRHLRDHGSQNGAIGTGSVDSLLNAARSAPNMEGLDLTSRTTTKSAVNWTQGRGTWRTHAPNSDRFRLTVLDFGVKTNMLRCLVDVGCEVNVVPASTSASAILEQRPDGVFLTNGPGDPAAVETGITTIRNLLGHVPIFGICLGHQLLALALGAKTFKLKFGHRGANQPVLDLTTGRVEITSQNHGFAVDTATLPPTVQMTHRHLNDQTCEGIAAPGLRAFSVQYHPEAAAGPHDSLYLFDRFAGLMRSEGAGA